MLRLKVALLAAASLLALTSCGIYQVVTLNPPEPGTPSVSDADNTFQFRSTADNNEDAFTGFELYYKFYYFNQTGNFGGDESLTSLQLLRSNGFFRVSSNTETTDNINPPLFFVPLENRGTVFDVTINFNFAESDQDPQGVSSPLGAIPTVTLQRGIADNRFVSSDAFKPFTAFASDDTDISYDPRIWSSQSVSQIPIQVLLYVLSYGKSTETFEEVYSLPIYLGSISVNFPVGQ